MLTPVSSKLEVVSWIVKRSINNWCFSTIFQIMTQRRWWNATLTSSMTCTDSGVYSTWYRLRNFRVILKQFDFLQVTRTRKVTCVNCGFFLFEFSKSNPHKKLSEGRELFRNSWHQLSYPHKCSPIIRTNRTTPSLPEKNIIFAEKWHWQNCYLNPREFRFIHLSHFILF